MAIDHDGMMWIGGSQWHAGCGFGKFTGTEFEFYDLGEFTVYPDIMRINIDPKNNIWRC